MSKSQDKVESHSDNEANTQPVTYTKSDYIKARAVISSYKEQRKNRPKRSCSEKQLEALRQGREKNKRNKSKQTNDKN